MTGCETLPGLPDLGQSEGNIGEIGEKDQPSPADVYVQLAVAYMQRQRYPQALQNAREGLARDPDSASAHNVIALIFDQLGEWNDAERHFQRAVSLQPKNPYYHNAYGFYLCKRERYAAADQEFVAALRNPLYSSPGGAHSNAGVCALRNGEKTKAEEYFLKALQRSPTLRTPLIEMAELSLERNKVAVARDYLRRYHKVATYSPRSLWLGIRAARALGDQNTVASYELKLRGDFPDSNEYRLLQGSLHQ